MLHALFRVEESFVKVDIYDVGTILNLLASDCERLIKFFLLDQLSEARRASDVSTLAYDDEVAAGS